MANVALTGPCLVFSLLLAMSATRTVADEPFDGSYVGNRALTVRNNSAACDRGESSDVHLTIKNNQFRLHWGGQPVDVTIAGDGVLNGGAYVQLNKHNLANVTVTGRANAGGLEADYGTARCAYHLSLKKA